MHRRGQHRRSSSLRGVGLETNAKLGHQLFCVGQNIHQMRNGRALIPADIPNTTLKQCFGYGQNAFARENIAFALSKVLYFCNE